MAQKNENKKPTMARYNIDRFFDEERTKKYIEDLEKEQERKRKKEKAKQAKAQAAQEREEKEQTRYNLYRNNDIEELEVQMDRVSFDIFLTTEEIKEIKKSKDISDLTRESAIRGLERRLKVLEAKQAKINDSIRVAINTNESVTKYNEAQEKHEAVKQAKEEELRKLYQEEQERLQYREDRIEYEQKILNFIKTNPEAEAKFIKNGKNYDEIYRLYFGQIDAMDKPVVEESNEIVNEEPENTAIVLPGAIENITINKKKSDSNDDMSIAKAGYDNATDDEKDYIANKYFNKEGSELEKSDFDAFKVNLLANNISERMKEGISGNHTSTVQPMLDEPVIGDNISELDTNTEIVEDVNDETQTGPIPTPEIDYAHEAMEPEGDQIVTQIKNKIMNIDFKKAAVVAGAIAAGAFVIATGGVGAIAVASAGVGGYAVHEFNKGRKL